MSMTRANVEAVLVKRLSPILTKAGMAVTYAGANADLNDPIGWALRKAGYSVADVTSVTSAEVADVSAANADKVIDLAEFRTLETILTNLDDVDVTVGPRSEKLSQLAAQVEKRLDRLQKRIEEEYGFGASAIQAGYLTYTLAEHYTGS